jgi:hypothetical protein
MRINEIAGLNRDKVRAALWYEWQQDAWAGDEQSPEEMDNEELADFEREVDRIVAWGNEHGITSAALAVSKWVLLRDQSTLAGLHGAQGLS